MLLVACSTDQETPAPPASEVEADQTVVEDDAQTTSAPPADDAVPQVIESSLLIDELDELVERTGLSCEGAEGNTSETHSTRMCERVLVAVFTDVSPMDGYVDGYLQRGNSVVVGANWFVTGKPALIEPLVETLG